MTPAEYYETHIALYNCRLKQVKQHRNLATTGKLLIFAGFVFQIYWFISIGGWFFLSFFPTVGLFILLSVIDNRIVRKLRLTAELIRINQEERDYLNGNLDNFPTGQEYLDPGHPYAADLDIFGGDSLFQHLNRTVTSRGTDLLADWLLHLSKDPTTICKRQQAAAELARYPEWCQLFRAEGKLRPLQKMDFDILKQWQEEPAFFLHPQTTRIWLYTVNGLSLLSWSAVALGWCPWPLASALFFGQLLVLSLYLKKINSHHRKLDSFIGTVSQYLPLVRSVCRQSFASPWLQELKKTFSSSGQNALKAFRQLKSIHEKLDQRGNILIAFLLNGLYLKDIHTMLELDRWKKEYGCRIDDWIQTLGTIDALVSMANYRLNHPAYAEPRLGGTRLLEAYGAGHPLLTANHKVTNDFHIDGLHRLFIVTGANMAGKSTFLRTIGINLVLAQSGNVVDSSSFNFQPMALFTSMRTTDNLAKNTSYFHAELLRLKQLVLMAEKEERLFVILDEMLKGTNSVDKLNGSLAFLRKLLAYPVSGLIATHDLALGELANAYPENFFNVCFEITHSGESVRYDYKLHPGISTTMNASILLKQMGLI